MVVTPVLEELQHLADSTDPIRRARGRRGLEVLETLKREPFVDLEVIDDPQPETKEVDLKLDGTVFSFGGSRIKAAALRS